MKTTLKKMTAALTVILVGAVLAATASAQCTSSGLPNAGAKLHRQAWRVGDPAASLILTSDDPDPIVGMWQVKFISEGNAGITDGTVIDNTFVQWHADGTEIMNSSRPPASGDFCLGIWKNLGNGIYKLNHFGIAWDPSVTTGPLGPGNIRENLTLAKDQNAYSGKFTIQQYDESGNLLQTLTGNIAARRITVDTHVSNLF
jgi:hypothetical protein